MKTRKDNYNNANMGKNTRLILGGDQTQPQATQNEYPYYQREGQTGPTSYA